MRPRRALPPDQPIDPGPEDEQQELGGAKRRALRGDESVTEPPAPSNRRAARAAPDETAEAAAPDAPETAEAADQPDREAPQRASRAALEVPLPEAAAEASPAPEIIAEVPPTAAAFEPAATKPPGRKGTQVTAKLRRISTDRDWRRVDIVVATALATWLIGLGIGVLPAAPAPTPNTVPLITAISRICPASADQSGTLLAAASEGDIGVRTLGSDDVETREAPLDIPEQGTPVVISPTSPQASVVGGNLIATESRLWWGSCRSALADQYVQLPGGADSQLLIMNSEPEDALIDVTLSATGGEITGEGLRGLTIPANSQHVINLAEYAGDTDALGARVRSSVGRVQAVGVIDREWGGDFASSTVQGDQIVIAAVPAETDEALLLLTNPGTGRNVVRIEAISEAGRYDLEGYESFALNAQATVAIDLTEELDGLPVGLVISGREQFSASLSVDIHEDLAILPGQVDDQGVGSQDILSVVAGPGILQVANTSMNEALVVIDWGEDQARGNLTIDPGAVDTVEVPAGAEFVRLSSTAPVAGAVLLNRPDLAGFAVSVLQPAARSTASMPMRVAPGLGR